ncbi:hypothetical protein ACLB1R_08550 [Escherichia coli]
MPRQEPLPTTHKAKVQKATKVAMNKLMQELVSHIVGVAAHRVPVLIAAACLLRL